MAEKTPADGWLANVKIVTHGATAEIFIDGKKVGGVRGYEIKHDTQGTAVPLLTLQVNCNLDIETQMTPLLPEPWSWFYTPKSKNFVDIRDRASLNPNEE